ncbi:MAG: hypothetical protein QOG92_496 [Verrucomicrobiota bacterium]|nr:hypothetical protein [Verrucomicrobiota bacterium]
MSGSGGEGEAFGKPPQSSSSSLSISGRQKHHPRFARQGTENQDDDEGRLRKRNAEPAFPAIMSTKLTPKCPWNFRIVLVIDPQTLKGDWGPAPKIENENELEDD